VNKKYFLGLFFIIFISFIACKRNDSEQALLYNNQIVSLQDELTADVDTFLQSVNYPDANTAILYKSAQNTAQSVTNKLKNIKQFEGGTTLFLETQNYINTCQTALQDEGSRIVHLKAKLSINYNKDELEILNRTTDSLFQKVNTAAMKFDKVQLDFARKYNFDIDRP